MKKFLWNKKLYTQLTAEEIDSIVRARRKKGFWVFVAIALIVINAIRPTAISFSVGIVFFCAICGTGFLAKAADESNDPLKNYIEDEKNGIFLACYLTYFIPGIYSLLHDIPLAGISDRRQFLICVTAFVILLAFMVGIVIKNWKVKLREDAVVILILIILWGLYLANAFLCLNYLLDKNYSQKETAVEWVHAGRGYDEYIFYDDENEQQTTRAGFSFVGIFGDFFDSAIIREGEGAFGIAYKNVFVKGVHVDADYWDDIEGE